MDKDVSRWWIVQTMREVYMGCHTWLGHEDKSFKEPLYDSQIEITNNGLNKDQPKSLVAREIQDYILDS